MKHLILLFSFSLLIFTCKKDDASELGGFEYTISSVASETISGFETNLVEGSFNMSLYELLGGRVSDQEINIQGQFTAVK